MRLSIGDESKSEGWELMVSTNYALVERRVYLHAITENSRRSIYIERGARRQTCLGCLIFYALREDGLKVLVVRLLVKAKGADIVDECTEGSG